jgi:hypothetical protein
MTRTRPGVPGTWARRGPATRHWRRERPGAARRFDPRADSGPGAGGAPAASESGCGEPGVKLAQALRTLSPRPSRNAALRVGLRRRTACAPRRTAALGWAGGSSSGPGGTRRDSDARTAPQARRPGRRTRMARRFVGSLSESGRHACGDPAGPGPPATLIRVRTVTRPACLRRPGPVIRPGPPATLPVRARTVARPGPDPEVHHERHHENHELPP